MVNLATQQPLGGANHPLATGEHAVNPVARMIPQGQSHGSALAIGPAIGTLVELMVLLGRAVQQVNLADVEESPGDVKSPFVVGGNGGVIQDSVAHGRDPSGELGVRHPEPGNGCHPPVPNARPTW